MEFDWSPEDEAFRRDLVAFLDEALPEDWEALSKQGPGGDDQARFSREFAAGLAARGGRTQHWAAAHGGNDESPWRHAILG